jgi:DNA-binding GntR family transcriptional regulator
MVLTDAVSQAQEEHRELLRLYSDRDIAQTISSMRDHILNAKEKLTAAIAGSRTGPK